MMQKTSAPNVFILLATWLGLACFSITANADLAFMPRRNSSRIIADPDKDYVGELSAELAGLNTQNVTILRVEGDFNNDGIPDLLFTDLEEHGTGGGGGYELYLGDKKGGFHDVGSLRLTDGFRLIPMNNGSAKLIGCWAWGAGMAVPYSYIVSGHKVLITPASELPGSFDDSNTDSPAYAEYCDTTSSNIVLKETCSLNEWLRAGKCDWHLVPAP